MAAAEMHLGRPRWGLALSGGALRATAQIGVLQELVAAGLRPDYIAGTSMGAVIAGLYASGMEPEQIATLAKQVKVSDLVDSTLGIQKLALLLANLILDFLGISPSPLPPGPLGLIKGEKVERFLAERTKGRKFAELRLPCALVAVDLHSGETVIFTQAGQIEEIRLAALPPRSVVITDAYVHEAMRASSAIPGVFVPKVLQSRHLVDGAVKDNVPVEALKYMGARFCVASTLEHISTRQDPIDTIPEVITQSLEIMGTELNAVKLDQYADYRIITRLYDVQQSDYGKVGYCIEQGRAAARAALPELKAKLGF